MIDNEYITMTNENGEELDYKEYADYDKYPHDITSRVAYLIGIRKDCFDDERFLSEVYEELANNEAASIIRHLCTIRTSIERNFKNINDAMTHQFRSIDTMSDYIPFESTLYLEEHGISFIKKSSIRLSQHVVELNRLIADRINNCKGLFPTWVEWEYIRDLFIMPNGLTEEGTKAAAEIYYANKDCYPYKLYINWVPRNEGNILQNDNKFMTLLYSLHNDSFEDDSKVSDISGLTRENIYKYIEDSKRLVMVVDCENSDPYKLCAALTGMSPQYTSKISSIILFDDEHTTVAWQELYKDLPIRVDYVEVPRIKADKSLVDMKLAVRTCQEYYENDVDSFIIVSSDSDYWGLISSIDARYMLMVEYEKCGPDLKNALREHDILYCYLDKFYSGNAADELKKRVMFSLMDHYIAERVQLNVQDMLETALKEARLPMSETEKHQFFERHIKTLQTSLDEDGNLQVKLKRK